MQCQVTSWAGCGRLRKLKLHCALQKREVKSTGEVLFPERKKIQEEKKVKGKGKKKNQKKKREGKRWWEKKSIRLQIVDK